MEALIGMTQSDLSRLIEEATIRGIEAGKKMFDADQQLNCRKDILTFLCPDKPISVETFNRNRRKGMYGNAIVGEGTRCTARKSELMDAIHRYQLSQL